MRTTVLLAVLLATLATSQDAQARTMTWDFAELVARDYWQQRDLPLICDPQPRLMTIAEEDETNATYPVGVYMLADLAACEVLITPTAEAHRTDNDQSWSYCQGVVHEFGHHAGLEHDYGDIMDHTQNVVPFGCAHPRQWTVKQGWRKPPRWVRRSPARVERLWLAGRVWRAQAARARWLRGR